jgi:endo-1,3-1,4-beta-glycanase ExoK
MPTDTTDRSLKKFLQDWQPRTVVAVGVLAFAFCVAIFSALRHPSEHFGSPTNRTAAPRVADMAPWSPGPPTAR